MFPDFFGGGEAAFFGDDEGHGELDEFLFADAFRAFADEGGDADVDVLGEEALFELFETAGEERELEVGEPFAKGAEDGGEVFALNGFGTADAETGVYTVVRPHAPWGLKLEEQVMAQMLGSAGYETAVCGKWHLGEFEAGYRPTRRGFDHQYGPWFGAIDYYTHRRGAVVDWHRDDEPSADEGYATELLGKEACRVIREKRSEKPLFLYLPFNAVHTPHQVPEGYVAGYPELKGLRRTYAGMLAAMDEAIGKVVAALEEKGMMDETLVIFASDNGGPSPGRVTSNGELRAGKGTVYEGGIRSCSFVHWRGRIRGGQTIREPLHAADWYPTLAKLTGAPLEQKLPLDGKDIWPVLTAGAKTPHEVLLVCGTRRGEAAVRMGDWKLVVGAGGKGKEGAEELYHLAEDPGEKRNLAGERGEKVRELRARYEAMMEKAVPSGEVAGGLKE